MQAATLITRLPGAQRAACLRGGAHRPSPARPVRRVRDPAGRVPTALPGAEGLLPDTKAEALSELPNWLALVGFAASQAGKLPQASPDLVFQGLAAYQLAFCALAVALNKYEFDRIGSFVAPAWLAIRALPPLANAIAPVDAATALFGTVLSRSLPGPLAVWLASLAGAIYYGYGPHWTVAAVGLTAAWRLYSAGREGGLGAPALAQAAFVGLAGWALYRGAAPQLQLLVFLAHLLAATIT